MRASEYQDERNMRDLSGLTCGDVGSIRPGRIFRGAVHDRALPSVPDLRDEPLHFFDLRRSDERAPEGRVIPISEQARRIHRHAWPVDDPGEPCSPAERDDAYYVRSASRAVGSMGPCLNDLLRTVASGAPVFIGCRLGKDRTGLVVLLLGRLLNVPENELISDYIRTAESFRRVPGWISRYAWARGEDDAEILRRLTPAEAIPAGVLAELPPSSAELAAHLGISSALVVAARGAVT